MNIVDQHDMIEDLAVELSKKIKRFALIEHDHDTLEVDLKETSLGDLLEKGIEARHLLNTVTHEVARRLYYRGYRLREIEEKLRKGQRFESDLSTMGYRLASLEVERTAN